ncbi:MAG: sulfatase-like hydrolase/transferase [Armatimonadetes bacterium]|nr:sulfatase-like hydrolase/transferase [Armatimonadota bacterium]MDW8122716.1 sulfatase [Armatimonadota bacterium]
MTSNSPKKIPRNLVVICLDSFRKDHVSCYHGGNAPFSDLPPCSTPHIDAFAQLCVVFDNALPSGLPTIPVRYELMTGQFGLPYRGWEPLNPYDRSIAEILRINGFVCGLITDTYHYFRPYQRTASMNYHRGFHSVIWIRGQEYDPYMSHPPSRKIDDYVTPAYPSTYRNLIGQYLSNTDHFVTEKDYFPAQVMQQAIDWLKKNRHHQRVFCWIDSFDPHEPWDPPPRFDPIPSPSSRPRLILPLGEPVSEWANPQQVQQIRLLYAGECAFVDHCLGWLFEALHDFNYFEDSVIVLLADHGHPLADHGKFLKGASRLYSELLEVPLMIYAPHIAPGRRSALVTFPDVLPTIFDVLGLTSETGPMAGKSFLPVLLGNEDHHREAVICGYHESEHRCIRDDRWTLIVRPEGVPDELYNRQQDPKETNNLIDSHPEEAQRLSRLFGSIWFRRPITRLKGLQAYYEVL